ncbi:regulatory protein RecX [Ferruginibacter sp.]|uniref:regulatory protein RecX n=1 Tax=Ferruginibacter sp. TaxID=1940288 RepID=UPI002658A42E|nr:regulatory protein RecX [Ferruginibacter sp.]
MAVISTGNIASKCIIFDPQILPFMQQQFTPQQALPKAKNYCAYQERCHSEVKDKLYGFGLNKNETEQIISTLIEENYLNEERFAISFAGGHFRIKNWGRIKIKYELKKKMVSPYCIKKALSLIDEDAYLTTFNRLAEQKLKTLKGEKNLFIKRKKLQDHLLQKGYENDLVREIVNKI